MSELTKKALAQSLIKLLNQNTLEKITVKDITEECGVARNTFYYHFQDMYDLLNYLFISEADEIISKHLTTETWQDACRRVTDYLLTNKKMIYHVYNSINREHLERYMYSIMDDLMIQIVKEQAEGYVVEEEDIIFIMHFHKYALVGILMEWIRTGMKEPADQLIKQIDRVCTNHLKSFFSQCDAENREKSNI